ncbi:MAG: nucleoside hydrolase [Aeriscardovia sp.]|nr:nucleoside hydrolase [Aeriscardovia sp.]MBR3359477.1 nucleoside hydrolase [Aeriscardovia sp.]
MATEKIILDCDPGHDDAVAILLAVGDPRIDLLGVTTIGGNQSLDKVTYNARAMLELAGATDIPVHAGCVRPLVRKLQTAAYIHGETGLDGVDLPEPSRPLDDGHAVSWIIDTIMNNEPQTITLVPTGPLTNIALAARLEPRIVHRVKQVVLMGGAYNTGNSSPCTEFNIQCDPEAAHIVFNEDWPLTMIGLDLTHQALCTHEYQQMIANSNPRLAPALNGLMDYFRLSYQDEEAFPDPPTHDPCAVAYVIDPSLITTRKCKIDVELSGALTTGMTVADLRAQAANDCTSQVAVKLDVDGFWKLIASAVSNLH